MARSEARIFTSIWSDPDFRSLPAPAQFMYLFLLSQADLSHCGVIALRPGRWTVMSSGRGEAEVQAAIAMLENALPPFVLTDPVTGELLVRSLLRLDRALLSSKMIKPVHLALLEVQSSRLRGELALQLERAVSEGAVHPDYLDPPVPRDKRTIRPLPLDVIMRKLSAQVDRVSPELQATANTLSTSTGENAPSLLQGDASASHPAETSSAHVDRVFLEPVDTHRGRGRGFAPAPTLTDPSLRSGSAGAAAANGRAAGISPEGACGTAQDLVAEWIDHCRKRPPERVIGQVAKELGALLAEGQDFPDVRAALAQWHRSGQHPSTLASFVNAAANASPTGMRRSTTDERVAAAQALKAELRRDGDVISGSVMR